VEKGVCGKDPDVQSLQEILLYGLKGMCAYAHHARRLGMVDEDVDAFVEEALFATVTNVNFDMDSLFELVLECGRKNLRVMEMLDEGHVKRYGPPSPTTVYEGTKAGPGILVSGHDMVDLENLLEQTRGTGVNVYTHGEMMPQARASGRALRRRLAEAEEGVRGILRPGARYHQLRADSARWLQGSTLHDPRHRGAGWQAAHHR
jgi:hydroxylamine reductase (hybrid-cluster protein)